MPDHGDHAWKQAAQCQPHQKAQCNQLPPGSDPAAAALAVAYLLPGILVERQLGGRVPPADRLLAGLAAISWPGN